MKRITILILLGSLIPLLSFAQIKVYKSYSSIKQKCDYIPESINREIKIDKDLITISNFLNGGKEAAKLKINKILNKEYVFEGICTWYYCTDTKKDIFNGYQKVIIILSKKGTIDVFYFADEVTIYHNQLLY